MSFPVLHRESGPSHVQLILVLVIGVEEEPEEANNDGKKTPNVGEHLVKFSEFSVDDGAVGSKEYFNRY